MGHPDIINDTPFVLAPLFLADTQNRPVFVALIKATFTIEGDHLVRSDKQMPVKLAGEYYADPETSSLRYEPEGVYFKPACDVVLLGHARAPQGTQVAELQVGFRVGPVHKVVRVIGDRTLTRRAGLSLISEPQPFATMPLQYERAFGGWDRSDDDASKHRFEARNPVGVAYRKSSDAQDLVLPNLEDPRVSLQKLGDTPPPAGFGFIAPHWQPRAAYAGTYDKAWTTTRKPLLPRDFDPRFFNAASPGLIAPGYLNGDEAVVIVNASQQQRLCFALPGGGAPRCTVAVRGQPAQTLSTQLDTVVVNTDESQVYLSWRTHVLLPQGPHQLASARVH